MTVGSLFAGIGGFDLGLERAGMTVKWQVEIEPFALAVLEKHWPHVTRYTDVRELHGADVEPVDLICGGFPCQPHSLAGRRGGAQDDRDLWPEFRRLIRDVRPRWVVAENVSGLLSNDAGRFFGGILRDLAESGYDAEWDCLPASAVGAPHQRDRVWIVAYPADGLRRAHGRSLDGSQGATSRTSRGGPVRQGNGRAWHVGSATGSAAVADAESGARQRPTSRTTGHVALSGEDVADTHQQRGQVSAARIFTTEQVFERLEWWRVEPHVGRVAHGVPARVDRLRGLGNSIIPQIAEWIGRRILDAEGMSVLPAPPVTR